MNFLEKKIGYTEGNNFLLSTFNSFTNYIGYYNTLSGVAYAGKYTQTLPLIPNDTYASNVILDPNIDFDREVNDSTLTLPYSIDNITIQPNEFVTAQILNKIFYNINYNNVYVYSKCFIIDNNIPYNTVITFSYNNGQWNGDTGSGDVQSSFSSNGTPYIKNIGYTTAVAASFYNDEKNFSLYICSSSAITILSGSVDPNSYTIDKQFFSTYTRDELSNTLPYTDITDCIRTKNLLYVVDAGNKAVYKYDVTDFEAGDLSLNRRIYVESFGLQYSNRNKFEYPKYITADEINDRLFIYDDSTRLLTITDYDFNIISTNKLVRRTYDVKGIQYNPVHKTLHVLTSVNNLDLYFHTFNEDIVQINITKLNDQLRPEEKILNLYISKNNSNIFYIATNGRIIKKFLTSPAKEVGEYNNNKLGLKSDADDEYNRPGNFLAFTIFNSDKNYDWGIIIKDGRIIIVQDRAFYQSVSFSSTLSNYGYSDFKILNDEYVQANYINKELYKLLKNVTILKNDIKGKFTTTIPTICAANTSVIYSKATLNGYTYLPNYDYEFLDSLLYNYYIHENERVTPFSLNRCFKNIYNLQLKMLQITDITAADSIVQYVSADAQGKAVYSTLLLS